MKQYNKVQDQAIVFLKNVNKNNPPNKRKKIIFANIVKCKIVPSKRHIKNKVIQKV